MKKIIFLTFLPIVLLLCIQVDAYDLSNYCEFSSNKKIISEHYLEDFNNTSFKLYELEAGYAIYSIKDEQELFLEGSYESNSPYYGFLDKERLFYLGFGEYYYEDSTLVKSILSNEIYKVEELPISYNTEFSSNKTDLTEVQILPLSTSSPDLDKTDTSPEGFTEIKHSKYFKRLIDFPLNHNGTCGLVALSILLGYYDTFYNDHFIPNELTYSGKYYKAVNEKWVYDFTLDNIPLMSSIRINYEEEILFPLDKWESIPGTTQSLHDYLFDNYMHTFILGDDENGYPILNEELKKTMRDYMEDNCPYLLQYVNIHSGCLFYTHKNPKDYINRGLPVCLVLRNFSNYNESNKIKDHDVIAYGYKNDMFLVHSGWYPGTGNGTAIVLSSAVIYGYYSLEYTGPHVHSGNIYMESGKDIRYFCGCGEYKTYGFEHNYIYEPRGDIGHYQYCDCGDSSIENHEWIAMDRSTYIIKPQALICRLCGHIKLPS